MPLIVNVVAFKIGWLSSVAGAANQMPLLGPAVILAAIGIHLRNSSAPSRELALILITGLIGATWDSVMVAGGLLSYPNGTFVAGLAPYWIVAMWMSFGTTLNLAFRWLQSRLLLAALLGAVSGPASYYAGMKLGAVVFIDLSAAMIALGLAWALLLPALLALAKRFDDVAVAVRANHV